MKKLPRRLALTAAAMLLLWTAWYGRPVNFHDLAPGMDIEDINIFMNLYTGGDSAYVSAEYTESRELRLNTDTPEGQALLARLSSLRFRRSLFNPLRKLQNTPRATGVFMSDGDITLEIYLYGAEDRIKLQFSGGNWSYIPPGQRFALPCYLPDGAAAAKALSQQLWAQGTVTWQKGAAP